MTLDDWLTEQGYGAKAKLAVATGTVWSVIQYLAKQRRVATYALALRISAATGGAVTVEELCAPAGRRQGPKKPGPKPRTRKRKSKVAA